MGNIKDGSLVLDSLKYLPSSHEEFPSQFLRDGDLLFNRTNSAELVGKSAVYRGNPSPCSCASYLIRARLRAEYLPEFLAHYINSTFGRAWVSSVVSQQVGQANVNGTKLKALSVPVPPLPEQRQIVAEIEKQFTRLEAGVAALRRVQANLKRYRAAVLKAACEGRLVPTEAELAKTGKRKSTFESGEALLARILTERRKNWKGRGKYEEPSALDIAKLLPPPEGWVWATLDSLAEIKGGITKDQNRKHTAPARSVPYLRVANVQRGYIDLTEVKEIVTTENEIQELALKPGDILFNEGGDRDKLGRGWVWNGELPECIHQNHVFRARLHIGAMNPKLLSWYANTFGQKFFFDEGKHTTNLASISMTKLKGLPVPIPPPSEQTRIVAEVERRLSVVEELEAVVAANLQRATRLRQSILQKAFTGELV
jgi:type I restriction enzyme S subunit